MIGADPAPFEVEDDRAAGLDARGISAVADPELHAPVVELGREGAHQVAAHDGRECELAVGQERRLQRRDVVDGEAAEGQIDADLGPIREVDGRKVLGVDQRERRAGVDEHVRTVVAVDVDLREDQVRARTCRGGHPRGPHRHEGGILVAAAVVVTARRTRERQDHRADHAQREQREPSTVKPGLHVGSFNLLMREGN